MTAEVTAVSMMTGGIIYANVGKDANGADKMIPVANIVGVEN
jgi:hypothetical protein